jgi:predicted amidophosphoribosyltransferase
MRVVFKGRHPLLINSRYIPYAIVPRLNKDSQKILNKRERQEQSRDAYALSGYFKYLLRKGISKDTAAVSILVIDDVRTTGATMTECISVIEKHAKKYSPEKYQGVSGLTIAYEA